MQDIVSLKLTCNKEVILAKEPSAWLPNDSSRLFSCNKAKRSISRGDSALRSSASTSLAMVKVLLISGVVFLSFFLLSL